MLEQEIDYLDSRKSEQLISLVSNKKHKVAVLLMLDCGLRATECATLKLSNFDFRKRLISVQSLKKREKEVWRTLPISSRLYEAMADYLKSFENTNPETYLFHHPSGKAYTRKAWNWMLANVKKKHSGFQNLHPHTLRHTFATHHLSNGTPLHEIKEMLGHVKYDTTLIYSHIPTEVLRQRIKKVTEKERTFFHKMKDYIFPPTRQSLINIQKNANNFIIGREKEMIQTIDLLNKNCNVILLGGIGIGKTHIMENVIPDRKTLRFDDFSDLKKTLSNCLIYLYRNEKQHLMNMMHPESEFEKLSVNLQKDSVQNLCKEIMNITEKHEYIISIENCDKITPKGIKCLEMLKDHFTIFTSAREIPVSKSSFLWNFEIIKLQNLSRSYSLELVHKLAYDIEIEDMELMRNHIYEQSNGNPRVIYEMCERYRKETIVTADVVRSIRHYGSMQEYDMSLVVMLLLICVAGLRYFAGEVGNDAFKLFGGCAMILLIFSRYLFSFGKRKLV